MSDYFAFNKKMDAMIKLGDAAENNRLFASDLGTKGAKKWIVSTDDKICSLIYSVNGKLRGVRSLYEVIQDTGNVAFGIDGDFKTDDDKFGREYDVTPDLLRIICKVNAFVKGKFDITIDLTDWIVTRAPYCETKLKHSFHLKLTKLAFVNISDVKQFAIALNLEEPGIDFSIYRRQPFRLTGCTKRGQNRPLTPFELTDGCLKTRMPQDYPTFSDYFKDTMLTVTNDSYIPVDIPASMRTTRNARLQHKNHKIVDLELSELIDQKCDINFETIKGLVDCLNPERADEYTSWFAVCSGIQRTKYRDEKKLFDLFNDFSALSAKYDGLDDVKKMWNATKKAVRDNDQISANQLFKMANKDNRDEYKFVIKTCFLPDILERELKPDFTGIPKKGANEATEGLRFEYEQYCTPHSKAVPKGYDAVIMISCMGTGKSFAVDALRKKLKPKRELQISPRIKYSEDAQRRAAEGGTDLSLYWQVNKLEQALSDIDALVISPESIFQLYKNRRYDLLNNDEFESILRQFSSTTMKNLPGSTAAFIDIMAKAKMIVFSDAHFSARSFELIKKVLGKTDKKILIQHNTYLPEERKAVEHVVHHKGTAHITKYQDKFIDAILEDIKAGKNLGVHSTSKTFSDRLVAAVVASGLLKPEEYRYYHGKQKKGESATGRGEPDPGLEDEIIENVNETWKGLRLVVYSPVFTVGVSFDCDKDLARKYFDRFYCYLTTTSVNASVAMQACQRIRHLNDKCIHFMVDDTPRKCCVKNLAEAKTFLARKGNEIIRTFEEVIMNEDKTPNCVLHEIYEEYQDDPVGFKRAHEKLLKAAAENPTRETPEIIKETLAYNLLENDLHHMNLRGFFYNRLRREGYTDIQRIPVEIDLEQPVVRTERDLTEYPFDKLPLISEEEYMAFRIKKADHKDTAYTNAAIDKYLFVTNIVQGSPKPVSPEDQAALFDDFQMNDQHKSILFHAYNVCRRTPREIMHKDMKKRPYKETTKADGAITHRINQLVELLELDSCHDTQTIVPRALIEASLQEFLKIINSVKILLNKPTVALANEGEDTSGDFRRVTRGLQTLFSSWLGLNFENAACRTSKIGVRALTFRLGYVDDFSEKLYTCGIV